MPVETVATLTRGRIPDSDRSTSTSTGSSSSTSTSTSTSTSSSSTTTTTSRPTTPTTTTRILRRTSPSVTQRIKLLEADATRRRSSTGTTLSLSPRSPRLSLSPRVSPQLLPSLQLQSPGSKGDLPGTPPRLSPTSPAFSPRFSPRLSPRISPRLSPALLPIHELASEPSQTNFLSATSLYPPSPAHLSATSHPSSSVLPISPLLSPYQAPIKPVNHPIIPTFNLIAMPPSPIDSVSIGPGSEHSSAASDNSSIHTADTAYSEHASTNSNDGDNTSFDVTADIYSPSTSSTGGTPLARRSSVHSLSRISFSAQLSRLTSLSLPLSSELSTRIRSLPTDEMCTALVSAGSQISRWINTAQKVLTGLDSEDDIEWAAQGKEALTEVDTAVKKFSSLMNVYIELIDELQSRPDSDSVDSSVFLEIVGAMEETVNGWKEVQEQLKGVKEQVEIALEWQELWKMVLKDIQTEMEGCQTALFELEERRHMEGADIEALETIMEDGASKTEMEDGALLGLVARMQPLRASLDFLPMRISSFTSRAEEVFPTACEELESRRNQLEKKWKRLNNDAENLKKELGEDRWVAIFRNAGKQATQMLESIERSMERLKTAVIEWEDNGRTERDMRELQKAMEGYEAKKMHYGSAIQRTFSIITRGIADRYTINGEIIRLSTVLATRWKALDAESAILDQALRDLQLDAQALRDSISSLNSLDILSPGLASPGTSPASSVQLNSPLLKPVDYSNRSTTSDRGKSPRRRPPSIIGTSPNIQKRQSRVITPTQSPIRTFSAPSTTSTTSSGASSNAYSPDPRKPRWNTSVKPDSDNMGHNFKPLSLTTPSPYRKVTPPATRRNSTSLSSRIPMPSPLGKDKQPAPGQPMFSPIKSPQIATRYRSGSNASVQNGYLASPTPQRTLRHQVSASRLRNKDTNNGSSASGLGSAGLNGSMSSSMGMGMERENTRPQSAMAHMHSASGRRSSLMYRPTTPGGSHQQSRTGSRQSVYGSTPGDGKPRWRY